MTHNFTLPIPTYQCRKRVQALKIKNVIENPRGYELHFEDERFCPIEVYRRGFQATGYFLIFEDGSYGWLPAAAFEAGYTLVDGGEALLAGDAAALARAWHAFAKQWPGGPSEVEAALASRDAEIERLRHALELAVPVMDAYAGPSRFAEFVSAGRAAQAARRSVVDWAVQDEREVGK